MDDVGSVTSKRGHTEARRPVRQAKAPGRNGEPTTHATNPSDVRRKRDGERKMELGLSHNRTFRKNHYKR